MIIYGEAPSRLSLFGGGTDLPDYVKNYGGGICISLAINLKQKMTMFSDNDMLGLGDHQFPYKANPEFYFKILDEWKINNGVHLTKLQADYDAIIEGGLGSSASAAVLLVGLINRRLNLGLTKEAIAEKAWELEVEKLGLFGGKQDQYAAALGGVNAFVFADEGTEVIPLNQKYVEKLLPGLLLFYSGTGRENPKIQEGLKELTEEQVKRLDRVKNLALKAYEEIPKGDLPKLGEMLDEAWVLKRSVNMGVSNERIDAIYEKAKRNGAYGGKVCGSGGGGYMFFLIDPKKREPFIEAMKPELEWWDFEVDWNGLSTRVIEP